MTSLVDTDWVADWLKGQRDAVQLLARLAAQDRLAISIITYGEIYDGIYYGRDPQNHERGFRQFLRSVDVLPLNRAIMRRFARIRGNLRAHGRGIPDPNILIAATAIEHGASLLTRNRRHFDRISDLTLFDNS